MCATSLNDDKFAHPVIFGVFEGQFCDMRAQKWAILPWPMLTFCQSPHVVESLTTRYGGIKEKSEPRVLRVSTAIYQHPPPIHGVAMKWKKKIGDGRRDPKGL